MKLWAYDIYSKIDINRIKRDKIGEIYVNYVIAGK